VYNDNILHITSSVWSYPAVLLLLLAQPLLLLLLLLLVPQ
jgi:hypothetical protein